MSIFDPAEQDHGIISASVDDLFVHENELQALQQLFASQRNPVEPSSPAPNAHDADDATDSKAYDQMYADMFDAVTVAELETMFPTDGKWKSWAQHPGRNGLGAASVGPGKYNPYQAGLWFLTRGVPDWSHERVMRKLAKNLPARSKHQALLLTGDLE